MTTRIQLCGRLEVELAGERIERRLQGRQGPLVLALLVLNRERPVPRDELIGVLWPDRPPANPDEALSALLSKVRQALGRDVLTGRRQLSLVLPEDAEVDVEQAAAAVARARAADEERDPQAAWAAAFAAAEIAGRGFLPGHDGPWVDERRAELEELRLRALELQAQAGLALGGPQADAAERAAAELIRVAPLREAGHRLRMEALAARAEVAEALTAYESLRVLLRDELGTAPGEAVRALHERLLTGEAVPPPPRRAERPPLPAPLSARHGKLVGREPELAALRAAWVDARAGRRRLVLVRGGPGIGKTRLAGELAREAHAVGTVLYAGCHEDALVAYQPFVEALRHYARSVATDALTGRLGPGAVELAALVPELVPPAPTSAPEDPNTRRYLLFEAVAALLTEAARDAPMLLVLDDLHWADRSTLQLLRHVVRAQQDAPVLILGTYRDTDVGPGVPLADVLADLRRDGAREWMRLDGLDPEGVGTLIAAHAGEPAPSALVRAVHAETEGNPFFVEEMIRHLIETGAARLRSGAWAGGGLPPEVGVPDGVKEVLGRRLARLPEACRRLLGHAAVLGREFGFDVLVAMSGEGEETAIDALDVALGARLVVEAPGGAYAFTHALVRETLYEGLSGPRRRRLHAGAARALEGAAAHDPEAQVAALALHLRLAGAAGDPAKGVEFSLRAGEHARRHFAWDEAAAHWDGALTLMERSSADPAVRARLCVALADIAAVAGDLAGQVARLGRALELYQALGDSERAAQVHSRLGQAHSLIDSIDAEHLDIRRAFAHFDAAREVLGRGAPRRARGHLEAGVATALTYGLRIRPGIEAAQRGMEIAERLGDEALWAATAEAYGWHRIVGGEMAEGFAAQERAFERADREQRPLLAWMALNILGQFTWGLRDPDGGRAHFERQLGLAYAGRTGYAQERADGIGRCHVIRGEIDAARRLLPDARTAWISHALLPLVQLWEGRWDAAEALARHGLATSRRTGNRWDEWAAEHLLGHVLRLRGAHGPAVEALERARAIVRDGGARYFEVWVLPDLARALAADGRAEAAREHVERCREILAAGEDWRGRLAPVGIAEGVVLSAEGRPDEADAAFAAALSTARRYGLAPDEADALRERGAALERVGDAARAAESRAAADELYARLGAGAPWLASRATAAR